MNWFSPEITLLYCILKIYLDADMKGNKRIEIMPISAYRNPAINVH